MVSLLLHGIALISSMLPWLFLGAALSFNRSIIFSFDGQTKQFTSASVSITDPGRNYRNVSIANGQTDKEVTMAITVANIKAYWFLSDKDVTLETNDGSSPAETIALKANQWVVWDYNDPHTKLLTTNVTKFLFTNASGAAANIEFDVIVDATP